MQRRERRLGACLGLLVLSAAAAVASPSGATYAAYSDHHAVLGNVAGAGIWAPNPPAACGEPSEYAGVVYGTRGDDVILGGNQRQVLMGLGGNDRIQGGNAGDCLVGGPGDDHLTGSNAKDVLLGGEGDDVLDGANGRDVLDAGGDAGDTCLGGRGKNTILGCLPSGAALLLSDDVETAPPLPPEAPEGAVADETEDAAAADGDTEVTPEAHVLPELQSDLLDDAADTDPLASSEPSTDPAAAEPQP